MTRQLIKIGIIYLVVVCNYSSHSQDDFIKMVNDKIQNINYVFEARIDSVQTYPGDKDGNPISYSKAEWNNGGGNFYATAYSKVWINVCRVYKGKLPEKITLLISNPYVSIYAEAQPNGDTTLGYLQTHPSHGDYDTPLLPSKSYPITKLYWCYDVSHTNKKGVYKINKFFDSPMKLQGSILNNHGYYDFGIIYALLGTKTFMTQTELSNYLKQIKTLKSNPRSRCN